MRYGGRTNGVYRAKNTRTHIKTVEREITFMFSNFILSKLNQKK